MCNKTLPLKHKIRFMSYIVQHENENACWIWIGSRNKFGYGLFGYDRVYTVAYRLSYELFVGRIPDGMAVRHMCNNPPCVNPKHLKLGTNAENMRDKTKPISKEIIVIDPQSINISEYDMQVIKFWGHVLIANDDECWKWVGTINKCGYGHIYFNGVLEKAHRVSWKLTRGEIENNLFVCHSCDNPFCVNPNHLFLGSQKDNMRDMAKKGRGARQRSGAKHPAAKYTQEDYDTVYRLRDTGMSYGKISKQVGMSDSHVAHILKNRSRNT